MTAREALNAANCAEPGERLRRYETICGPRGACRHDPLANDPGRWTWCPDSLTASPDENRLGRTLSGSKRLALPPPSGEPKNAAVFEKARVESQVRT